MLGPRFGFLRKALMTAALAVMDFSTPAVVGIGGNGTFASTYATDEWTFIDTAYSSGYAPNAGSETLTVGGTGLTAQKCPGVYTGSTYTEAGAYEAIATTDKLTSSGTAAGDFDATTEDFAFRLVFRVNKGLPSSEYLFAKFNTTDGGWRVYTLGTRWIFALWDNSGNTATVTATAPAAGDYDDGAVHVIEGFVNSGTATIYTKGDLSAEASASTAAIVDSTATGAELCVNGYDQSSNAGAEGIQVLYAGTSKGAPASNFYSEIVVLPGADPTGALTTKTRSGLISCQVGAAQVAHFSENTLPIGYNENFSDTDKLGLFCNSAMQNLISYSEDFASWTGGTVTVVSNDGNAPDEFRSADKLTATAPAAPKYLNFPSSPNTQYTASVWVKRSGVSDVALTGRLRDQDIGAGSDVTLAITATSQWVLHQWSYTHGATAVADGRVYLHIDTSGESAYVWGFQINEGAKRLAYARTSGSAETLGAPTYEAAGLAGVLATAAKGEIQATFVYPALNAAISVYMVNLHNGVNNENSRMLGRVNTGNARLFGYDSAAAAAFDEQVGAIADDTEVTQTGRWDNSGGLAVGGGAEAEQLLNGVSQSTEVGTFTATETLTTIKIGGFRSGTANHVDAFVQRVAVYAEEQAA